jgi:hypothetical protein
MKLVDFNRIKTMLNTRFDKGRLIQFTFTLKVEPMEQKKKKKEVEYIIRFKTESGDKNLWDDWGSFKKAVEGAMKNQVPSGDRIKAGIYEDQKLSIKAV